MQPIESSGTSVDVAAAWYNVGARLKSFVGRRVAPSDVDDIVQSVMLKLLERRHEIGAESVRAWLFAVTRNAVAEHYRQQRPTIDLDAFEDLPEAETLDAAERTIRALSECLDPMLDTLTSSDAELLRRVDLLGESQIDLARELDVPLSTLKSRVQRARTKLRVSFDTCCTFELSRGGAPLAYSPRCAPERENGSKGKCN
jgi:RNA polymerase sigma-70 factor, ECF subfamily